MENNYGLIDLTENELKEQNGGFFLNPIQIFNPFAFFRGLIEGYKRSTQE
jgi:hypothetical protein